MVDKTTRILNQLKNNTVVPKTTFGNLVLPNHSGVKTDPFRIRKLWHAYGGFQQASTVITIAAKDTYVHVTNATNDLWTGVEGDGLTLSGDVMTVINGGSYRGIISMTYSGGNNKDFEWRIYNITQSNGSYHVKATGLGAGNFVNCAIPFYIEANAGDHLRVEVACTTDASSPTVHDAVFTLEYIHE